MSNVTEYNVEWERIRKRSHDELMREQQRQKMANDCNSGAKEQMCNTRMNNGSHAGISRETHKLNHSAASNYNLAQQPTAPLSLGNNSTIPFNSEMVEKMNEDLLEQYRYLINLELFFDFWILSACLKCNVMYSCPRDASRCLRSHGLNRCWKCNLTFPIGFKAVAEHNRAVHGIKSKQISTRCPYCSQLVTIGIEFRRHIETFHFHLPTWKMSKAEDELHASHEMFRDRPYLFLSPAGLSMNYDHIIRKIIPSQFPPDGTTSSPGTSNTSLNFNAFVEGELFQDIGPHRIYFSQADLACIQCLVNLFTDSCKVERLDFHPKIPVLSLRRVFKEPKANKAPSNGTRKKFVPQMKRKRGRPVKRKNPETSDTAKEGSNGEMVLYYSNYEDPRNKTIVSSSSESTSIPTSCCNDMVLGSHATNMINSTTVTLDSILNASDSGVNNEAPEEVPETPITAGDVEEAAIIREVEMTDKPNGAASQVEMENIEEDSSAHTEQIEPESTQEEMKGGDESDDDDDEIQVVFEKPAHRVSVIRQASCSSSDGKLDGEIYGTPKIVFEWGEGTYSTAASSSSSSLDIIRFPVHHVEASEIISSLIQHATAE